MRDGPSALYALLGADRGGDRHHAGRGTRKTPGIINLAARTVLPDWPEDREQFFFWDGRATGLENQVLGPIANAKEMGPDHDAMVQRFSGITGYAPYFREALDSTQITRARCRGPD